ncbi:MAG: Killer protein [Alphaproteobacteria bacterium]|nr:Killer protein [Alphaproteobacteria bacterium]
MVAGFRHTGFRHKGLGPLYEKGDRRRLRADHADEIERILARLDEASDPAHMNLPGYRLHPLRGERAGQWAVSVSGNWRIVFRFRGGNADDVDLIDCH